jgi:hypothetical protein
MDTNPGGVTYLPFLAAIVLISLKDGDNSAYRIPLLSIEVTMKKTTILSDKQLAPFHNIGTSMGSLATLPMPGTYPSELSNCGINRRSLPRNQLIGYVATRPSGSQLVLETVFFDTHDQQDNGDLHVVNFADKTVTSYYRGWGTWTKHYGDNHREYKDSLRGTI